MIFKKPQIDSYIKNPSANIKAFLIYGENIGLVDETTKSLIKTVTPDIFDAFSVTYLEMDTISKDFGVLSAEYNAVSMMGDKRVVIIKNATDSLAKSLPDLFTSNSTTLLIINATGLTKGSSIVKYFEKQDELATFPCYDDKADDIAKAVKDKLVANQFTIDFDALNLLISRLSPDRLASMAEIDKLMMYMGSKKNISVENIFACVSDVSQSSFEDICYYAASGNQNQAQKSLETILKEGEDPSTIVTMLSFHFYKLLQVASLIEDGFSTDDAISKVVPRLLFLRKDSFKSQVRAWSKEKLLSINDLLYSTQKDLRTTNMPTQEITSYLLMQIASAFKK